MRKILSFMIALCINFGFADKKEYTADYQFDQIKSRGYLICGVSTGLFGFSTMDNKGRWSGFDIDFCKAISVAIFGSVKVEYIPMMNFTLDDLYGVVDIIVRYSPESASHMLMHNVSFITYFLDNIAIMHNTKHKVRNIRHLNGATACFEAASPIQYRISSIFEKNNSKFQSVIIKNTPTLINYLQFKSCDFISGNYMYLLAMKHNYHKNKKYRILNIKNTVMPFGIAVRSNAIKLKNAIKILISLLLMSEQAGINKQNIDSVGGDNLYERIHLIDNKRSITNSYAQSIGFTQNWAYKVLKSVGNYGDIYHRNLGRGSSLKIPRRYNKLYSDGGLLYPMPFV